MEEELLEGTQQDAVLGTDYAVAALRLSRITHVDHVDMTTEQRAVVIHNIGMLHEEVHLLMTELELAQEEGNKIADRT